MEAKIEELKKDIAELESLEKQAMRQKTKDILSIETRKIVSELLKLEELLRGQPSCPATSTSTVSNRKYQVKISNYAWDQTDKFVKFYVTLKNVHTLSPEKIKCQFTPKSFELNIYDLENKDYVLTINNLLKRIDPSQSAWKIKTDMIIISVAKAVTSEKWSHITEWEKKSSDLKAPKFDSDKTDPTEGLMSLMKNMYETGDDEMKRTIAKAWTESQMKRSSEL